MQQAAIAIASPTSPPATASSPTSPTAPPTPSPSSTSSTCAATAPCPVGLNPTGLAANPTPDKTDPRHNEIYIVNTKSGSISVIDATRQPRRRDYPRPPPALLHLGRPTGHRAYVANSGSNNVSVLDLDRRREIAVIGAGEQPGLARISPDMRSLVVTNRSSGSVSIFNLSPWPDAPAPHLRAAYAGCPGATDAVILPTPSRAFIACSAGHQVMVVNLAAAPDSWPAKQNASLTTDHLLALLDVGKTPVHLALKPDGGEIFVSNFDSDSISEIATQTAEVGGTYTIGSHPHSRRRQRRQLHPLGLELGADSIAIYSIDDGKLIGSVHTGSGPDSIAFSATSISCSPPTPTPATSPSSAPRAAAARPCSPSCPAEAHPTPSSPNPSTSSSSASTISRLEGAELQPPPYVDHI